MAASFKKADEDISNVLDKEDESDVFFEESDDFSFDTNKDDSDSDSDTSNVVHESEPYDNCYIFRILFYLTAWRVQDCISRCKWNECIFWNVFRSLLMKICGSCLLNKQIYTPSNFWQQLII